LSSHDLLGIQKKALQKGIPYQTLISGLIHQYVEGDLLEKH
jgi:predicted DNA binding CopG/RHH family protein